MTTASEWRRAAIAVTGVTIVLLIAAGIHFIAPSRPALTIVQSSSPVLPETETTAAERPSAPVLSHSDVGQSSAAARPRLAPDRAIRRAAVDRAAAASSAAVNTPEFDAPLVASLEVPENSLQLQSIGMPISGEFVEPLVPASDREPGDHNVASRVEPVRRSLDEGGRQRDPVTAAFVTAGSAVAGGFRSAGRAIKRAF